MATRPPKLRRGGPDRLLGQGNRSFPEPLKPIRRHGTLRLRELLGWERRQARPDWLGSGPFVGARGTVPYVGWKGGWIAGLELDGVGDPLSVDLPLSSRLTAIGARWLPVTGGAGIDMVPGEVLAASEDRAVLGARGGVQPPVGLDAVGLSMALVGTPGPHRIYLSGRGRPVVVVDRRGWPSFVAAEGL